MRLIKSRKGQSVVESALTWAGFCAVALVAIHYAKNAMDGSLKSSADRMGEQWNTANSKYTIEVSNTGKRKETVDEKGVSVSTITGDEKQIRKATEYAVTNDLTRKVTEQK